MKYRGKWGLIWRGRVGVWLGQHLGARWFCALVVGHRPAFICKSMRFESGPAWWEPGSLLSSTIWMVKWVVGLSSCRTALSLGSLINSLMGFLVRVGAFLVVEHLTLQWKLKLNVSYLPRADPSTCSERGKCGRLLFRHREDGMLTGDPRDQQ